MIYNFIFTFDQTINLSRYLKKDPKIKESVDNVKWNIFLIFNRFLDTCSTWILNYSSHKLVYDNINELIIKISKILYFSLLFNDFKLLTSLIIEY